MSASDLDYPQLLFDYKDGFLVSKTMFTACELGVFDLLHDVSEPMSAATIASHLGTNMEGTERLLSACVGLKLLKAEMKNMETYYSNSDISDIYLVKSSPKSLYHMMMYYSQTMYNCWNFLPQAVREGKSQYERAFGISSKDLFEALYRSEKEMLSFMHHMNSTWTICGKDVIQAFDLSTFHTVYDLGGKPCATKEFIKGLLQENCALDNKPGCSGALAKHFLSTYPGSTVTIMDLQKVVETAKKHFITNNDQGISFLEGDFFNDTIPEADLFIMARIVHDWTEDKCLHLLKKIYQSCRPGGAVLLIEVLLNEDKTGPLTSQLFSLNMLVQTEGRERTPSEYTKLLKEAGFKDVQFSATGKIYDAILGRK